jgi:hypothetical protein
MRKPRRISFLENGLLKFKEALLVESVVNGKNNEVVLDNAFTTVLLDSNRLPLIFPQKYNLPVS